MAENPPRFCRGRELAGLSIGQASKLLDMQSGRLLAIEEGTSSPEPHEVRAMGHVYHVAEAWLHGAAAPVPEDVTKMLREADISDADRAAVAEFAGMLALMPPQPPVADRLARIAAVRSKVPMPSRAAKVPHVKAQGQTRKHACHWPGCGRQVPPALWGCKEHWFRLPKGLRDRIWQAYRPGQEATMTPSAAYLQVADEAERWIQENVRAR